MDRPLRRARRVRAAYPRMSRRRPAPAESVRRVDTFARRLVEEGDSSPGS